MDFSSQNDDVDERKENVKFGFDPSRGDFLLELKEHGGPESIFVWRMIITPKNIKKIWPIENHDDHCDHENLFWAIDFKKRLITLCNDCESYALGQKVEK